MKVVRSIVLATCALAFTVAAYAKVDKVDFYATAKDSVGQTIGSVTLQQTTWGVLLTPNLTGLTPGIHGFHLHQFASCADSAMAAGGHYDPNNTGKHLGPYGTGHLGDMPVLYADAKGMATLPILAPRLKVDDFKGRAVMIHAGGDNYSDSPLPLGGGGARVACGVVQ